MSGLTHFDASGQPQMVDVSPKPETLRIARAAGVITMQPATAALIAAGAIAKGDVLSVARLAGIMGAKRTPDLIPLCHPVSLSAIKVELRLDRDRHAVVIDAECRLTGRTGVEMEALTAVAVAALTIYDMCKAVDRGMVIGEMRLLHKSGGGSGEWSAA